MMADSRRPRIPPGYVAVTHRKARSNFVPAPSRIGRGYAARFTGTIQTHSSRVGHVEDIDLTGLRREYAAAGLDEAAAGDDPIALFEQWMGDAIASGMYEPNAMALATATSDGQPSVRIVLLKGFDAEGARFYTNYESRKADELEANPRAACTLLWHVIQRQVRIEGSIARASAADSDAYFSSRPRGSRLGAIASPQSRTIGDRAELDARYADAEAANPDDIARPAYWGGYVLRPEMMEFWQGRESRMHDRIRFRRSPSGWRRDRLAP